MTPKIQARSPAGRYFLSISVCKTYFPFRSKHRTTTEPLDRSNWKPRTFRHLPFLGELEITPELGKVIYGSQICNMVRFSETLQLFKGTNGGFSQRG